MKAAVKLPEVTANFKNDHGLTVEWVSTQENCAHLHAKVEANSDFKLPHVTSTPAGFRVRVRSLLCIIQLSQLRALLSDYRVCLRKDLITSVLHFTNAWMIDAYSKFIRTCCECSGTPWRQSFHFTLEANQKGSNKEGLRPHQLIDSGPRRGTHFSLSRACVRFARLFMWTIGWLLAYVCTYKQSLAHLVLFSFER